MHTPFTSLAILSLFFRGFFRENERLDDITGCRYNARSPDHRRDRNQRPEKLFPCKAGLDTDRNIHQPGSGSCVQCRKSRHADKHERLWVQT